MKHLVHNIEAPAITIHRLGENPSGHVGRRHTVTGISTDIEYITICNTANLRHPTHANTHLARPAVVDLNAAQSRENLMHFGLQNGSSVSRIESTVVRQTAKQ